MSSREQASFLDTSIPPPSIRPNVQTPLQEQQVELSPGVRTELSRTHAEHHPSPLQELGLDTSDISHAGNQDKGLSPESQELMRGSALVCKALNLLRPDWSFAYRELARFTSGITEDDPCFQSIMNALNACDKAYVTNDWSAFQQARAIIRQTVNRME